MEAAVDRVEAAAQVGVDLEPDVARGHGRRAGVLLLGFVVGHRCLSSSGTPSGASAYGSILVAEEILDRWQRELKDDRVQPLVRMVCRVHVLEEMAPRLRGPALLWHQAALANPHYQQTLAWMGEKVTPYLDGLGLIPRHQRALWKRSLLLA